MQIEKLELFKVPPRWLFLKITTKSGLVGWGEPIVEGKADTVAAAVKEFSTLLIGKKAGDIEDIFNMLYRGGFYRGGPVLSSALSGIEQALWDIKGKYFGVPVYELLGGAVRDKMKIYSWVGGTTPQDFAKDVKAKMEIGYTAVKMGGPGPMDWIDSNKHIDKLINTVATIREECGYGVDIGIDFHGKVHKGMAKVVMHELEPYRIMFVEEPILCENPEAFIELKRGCSIPIATGERNYTRWGFKDLITSGGVDIIQPDLSHAGGILETKKIAAMAEAFDIAVAPHCPLGPIAFASCIQLDVCTTNAFIQEQSLGIHYNEGNELTSYVKSESLPVFENGYIIKPATPGLGIEVDEDVVREAAKIGHDWKNPILRNPDGCVTEW